MSIKEQALRLIEGLPDDMTWGDLLYEVYVRKSIDEGLADSAAGRVRDVAEVRARWGLST